MAIPKKSASASLPSLDKQEEKVGQLLPLDEVFSEVDLTEDFQEEEPFIEDKKPIPKREQSIESKVSEGGYDDEPFFEESKNRHNKEYIDRKNKKITPIGGKKAKIKDKDLDDRKNTLTGLKVFRIFVYFIIIVIVGLGIKNTFFPEQIYTNEEITAIAQAAIGETGFPTKRGEAYSKEYLKEYLTLTGSKSNKQLMNKLGTGDVEGQYDSELGRSNSVYGMKPVNEPYLFETKLVTEYTALFKYSVYMSNIDGRDVNDEGLLTGHWMSFSVSVYYDKEKDALSVIEPPALIPTYTIRKPNTLPQPVKLGNGEQDNSMSSTLKPTINGFIKAFANVDVNNNDEIIQYIPNEKPVELLSGFGGSVVPRKGDSSITSSVFKSTNPDEWKVDVTVEWMSTVVPEEQAPSFTSHYVMTIKKTNEDVYLVTKFAPYVFIAKDAKE